MGTLFYCFAIDTTQPNKHLQYVFMFLLMTVAVIIMIHVSWKQQVIFMKHLAGNIYTNNASNHTNRTTCLPFFLGFSSKVCSKGFKLQTWNDKSQFLSQFQSLDNLLRLWHFILSRVLTDSSSCIYCMKKKQSIKSSMLQMVRWQKTLREWKRCWHYQIGFLLQILAVLAFLWEVENCWPLRKDHTQICDESGMRQQSPNLQVSLSCWYCLIRLQHKRREGLKSSLINTHNLGITNSKD